MKLTRLIFVAIAIVFVYSTVAAPAALAQSEHPPSRKMSSLKGLNDVPVAIMPELDTETLLKRDMNKAAGTPFQFAEPVRVSLNPKNSGSWETLKDGSEVWRLRIHSAGAYSLNFGFSYYQMPEGGKLWVYSPGFDDPTQMYTAQDNEDHGELWTPIVRGEEAMLELVVPAGQRDYLGLELSAVNHAYRPFGLDSETQKDFRSQYSLLSGSCNVDVICGASDGLPAIDNWRNQIRSVGRYTYGGGFLCSGALINNTAGDSRPLFLTAEHCGIEAQTAASVVTYWNFQNSTCRQPNSPASGSTGNGSLTASNSGAYLRATFADADMALIEFDDPLNPTVNHFLAGWDRSDFTPSSAIAIHHPAGHEKRISFENDATQLTLRSGTTTSSFATHIRVIDWDLGTTEGGSSGSPLFDSNGRIVGQLTGGDAACGNNESDWYGRIFTGWTGGLAPESRLKDWLDPLGTGESAIDGINSSVPEISLTKTAKTAAFSGQNLEFSLKVTNRSASSAAQITIVDQIPAYTTLVPSSLVCAFSQLGSQITVDAGLVPALATRECTYTVFVSPGLGPRYEYLDDFESGLSSWSAFDALANPACTGRNPNWVLTTFGTNDVAFADNYSCQADQILQMNTSVPVPNNGAVSFWHRFSTEERFDGGIVEYSVNDGTSWTDLRSFFVYNTYSGMLSTEYGNPIGGRRAFTGKSGDWIRSIADVSSLAGQSIRLRFRFGTDESETEDGWYIDDVMIGTGPAYLTGTACASTPGGSVSPCVTANVPVQAVSITGVLDEDVTGLPDGFQLSEAFPNPFNPTSQFLLEIEQPQHVVVEVYDSLGRLIQTLNDGPLTNGQKHTFLFDAAGLPSGLYIYRARGESFSATGKMLLLK